jgi:uncharacterized protein YjbI with pentapeptide repeats
MANDEDIQRAKLGAEAWNQWMRSGPGGTRPDADFSEATLDDIDFSGFQFPQVCTFEGAVFREPARFQKAVFRQQAIFKKARFHDEARFTQTSFAGRAQFRGAKFAKGDFGGANFSQKANFSDACFKGSAAFPKAAFEKGGEFRRATFEGIADFDGIRVSGDLFFSYARLQDGFSLDSATLQGRVHFFYAEFSGDCRFVASRFNGPRTGFDDSTFDRVPDLRSTFFAVPPSFHHVDIGYARAPTLAGRLFNLAQNQRDGAKYRRLKQLAFEAKDHERELNFFILEQRAKRWHEYRGLGRILLDLAYDWISEYGRSIIKPVACLLALTLISFLSIAQAFVATWSELLAKSAPILVLAATNSTLLIGSDKWLLREKAVKALYVDGNSFGLYGELLAYGQSALSLLLLFLIGLALRNRFRIGSGG